MIAREITLALKGRWHGTYGTACCPSHSDTNPSLSLRDGDDGQLLAYCFAGCNFENILDGLRHRGLLEDNGWKSARPVPALTARETKKRGKENAEAATRIWRECQPASGTLAERYLRSRHLSLPFPQTLRYHPNLFHGSGGTMPALVSALCRWPSRDVTGIHRTYLQRDGRGKADIKPDKMALGSLKHSAVRLAPAGQELGLCEGIEDGLTVMQIYNVPCWAACGGGIADIILPPEVRCLTIFADNDKAGRDYAESAAERHALTGRQVRIAYPQGHEDFNAQLKANMGRAAA